jgi:uncharacterized caspase-like protein
MKDAEDVMKRLKGLGFDNIITLFDDAATRQNILHVLGEELFAKTGDNDRVLIFFSGHGQTENLPSGGTRGYIIPYDSDAKDYYSTSIRMEELQDLSDRLRAKHILYIMDSCFSGLLLQLRGETEADFSAQTTRKARQVLTAGQAGEKVGEFRGHGLFTQVLLDGLDGQADGDHNGYVTASELYQFIAPRVLQETKNKQNPSFGRLGIDPGEFVFTLKK